MKIRAATEKDLNVCEKLLKPKVFRFADGGYPTAEFLKEYLDDNYFLVVEDDNKIIGCTVSEPIKDNGLLLWFLVVKKELRGKGIGRKLLDELELRCKKTGKEWINLYSGNNKKTLDFYRKNNFFVGERYVECKKLI